jgi:hypothetical protein
MPIIIKLSLTSNTDTVESYQMVPDEAPVTIATLGMIIWIDECKRRSGHVRPRAVRHPEEAGWCTNRPMLEFQLTLEVSWMKLENLKYEACMKSKELD